MLTGLGMVIHATRIWNRAAARWDMFCPEILQRRHAKLYKNQNWSLSLSTQAFRVIVESWGILTEISLRYINSKKKIQEIMGTIDQSIKVTVLFMTGQLISNINTLGNYSILGILSRIMSLRKIERKICWPMRCTIKDLKSRHWDVLNVIELNQRRCVGVRWWILFVVKSCYSSNQTPNYLPTLCQTVFKIEIA